MRRRLAYMVVGVSLAGCAFDSGGVGGPDSGGLGDGTGAVATTGTEVGSGAGADTQGSGDASVGEEVGSSTEPTPDPDLSTSGSGPPPDPCAGDNGCDVDASCAPDPSGEVAVCDCNAGFEGDGVTCVVSPVLPVLRVEAECKTTVVGYCTTDNASAQVQLVGEPGAIYTVTLRVRGVVERKSYDGGEPDGLWHPGGEPGAVDLWNEVTLSIPATPSVIDQTIRLNSGSSGSSTCVAVDMTHEVTIEAGAILELSIDAIDGSQVANDDDLVVPGIPPAPDAFDGQFVQIDAIGFAAI